MYAEAHLQTALLLVNTYRGELPFPHFARQYFASHKKHGSRDRKQIQQLCYAYFRMGHALPDWQPRERMLAGLWLTSFSANPLLAALQPEWNEQAGIDLAAKAAALGVTLEQLQPFPWLAELSERIDAEAFSLSHFSQPDLFARIRPGYHDAVIRKLEEKWISYQQPEPDALRLPNGYDVATDFTIDKELVIQDLSSQRTGKLLSSLDTASVLKIWDCCAASGGKAIQTADRFPKAFLTVSDIRQSILVNLSARFVQAGIRNYKRIEADLSVALPDLPMQDLIIADVPCTGSGTWSRAPENLLHFKPETIDEFAALQKKIVGNVLRKLRNGGYLLYITCSVLKKENEQNIALLTQDHGLTMVGVEVLKGYTDNADTMFAALLQK